MKLTPALKMAICQMLATSLVSRGRAEAPAGFDPQMSSAAIIGAVAAVGSAAYAAKQAHDASKAQQDQIAAQNDALAGNPLGKIPDAARYEPVDFTQAQLDSIDSNQQSLPFIRQLLSQSNNFVTSDALRRAERLIPNYSKSMATLGDSTLDLLGGRLPFEDALDIVSNRAGASGGLNIPGLATAATTKDLGLSKLDAIGKGTGLLGQMVSMAETVSPRSSYGKPSDFFVSPLDRIRAEMDQHQLIQQSDQSANNLEAGADPNNVARAQLALGQASQPPVPGMDYASAANQIIKAAGGVYGAGTDQGWWGTAKPNAQGGYATEAALQRAVPNSFDTVNVPGRGWQPVTEAEWYGGF